MSISHVVSWKEHDELDVYMNLTDEQAFERWKAKVEEINWKCASSLHRLSAGVACSNVVASYGDGEWGYHEKGLFYVVVIRLLNEAIDTLYFVEDEEGMYEFLMEFDSLFEGLLPTFKHPSWCKFGEKPDKRPLRAFENVCETWEHWEANPPTSTDEFNNMLTALKGAVDSLQTALQKTEEE